MKVFRITEIGGSQGCRAKAWARARACGQAMMEVVKNTNLNNLVMLSTEIDRVHMDPEFWFQQHTLDTNAQHMAAI